jgi:glucose/arabinose dehydrogenase
VVVWASHSSPEPLNGKPNSGMVSRLNGSGLSARRDVITGLPRAKIDHSTNSLHFGPDGRLYVALASNTAAGAPNPHPYFGQIGEQALSAAIVVADVRRAGFDGSCAPPDFYAPAPCDVKPYATGLRNAYDFVFHPNGYMYSAVNGLGNVGSFPTSPRPPCSGIASERPLGQGGQNPGPQPDLLQRVEQGRYYGHPNPSRGECVFADGRYQGVPPLPNYSPPIFNLGDSKSANGTVAYRSRALGGVLRGDLLIANWSVGDDITRIRLSADGKSVVSATTLASGFENPLPLAEGRDGTLYVGEHGGDRVTVLRPAR